MDVLTLKSVSTPYEDESKSDLAVQILINGKEFLDMVQHVELAIITRTGVEGPAGAYRPLSP